MRSLLLGLLGVLGFVARGAAVVSNPNGMLEVATTNAIQQAIEDAGSDGLVLGNGMLRWTGGDATWKGDLTVSVVSNLDATVNVVNSDATLTIDGSPRATACSAFVKTGPGTLEFTHGGTNGWYGAAYTTWGTGWWKTYAPRSEGAFLSKVTAWDETTGIATNGGYTTYTVLDGTVRYNAPGETFYLPYMPWVGGFTEANARMEITNRTKVVSYGGWFSIGRGTTTSASTGIDPTLRLDDQSSITVGSICMGNGNGRSGYYCRSRLEIDGGSSFGTGGAILHPEASGAPVILVTNRSVLSHWMTTQRDTGFRMDYASSTLVGNCSTVLTETASMGASATLEVTGGSVLKLNRGIPTWYNSSATRGKRVFFDDARLEPYRATVQNEWFGNKGTGYTNVLIGAGGLTLGGAADAWLGTAPKSAGAGATLTQAGSGTVHLKPFTNVPVALAAGGLGYTAPYRLWTNGFAQTIAPAAGTWMTVAGEGALGGSKIAPADDFTLNFLGRGKKEGTTPELDTWWTCRNWARVLHDGTLQLTLGAAGSLGIAWRNEKIDLTQSFEISFDSYSVCSSTPAYGWMLVLQSKDTARYGGGSSNFGYNYGSMISNDTMSCAFGLNLESPALLYGTMGNSISTYTIPAAGSDLAAKAQAPLRNVFRYDAAAKTATLTVHVPATHRTFTRTVALDLATQLGATTGYWGFTATSGSTNGRICEHCIRNVRHLPTAWKPAKPGVVRTGGNLTLASGKTLTANLAANELVGAFALDSLSAAGTAKLNVVDAHTSAAAKSLPALTLADHDLWTLSGKAYWRADGTLANSQAANSASGGSISKYAYPVRGSWRIAFNWRLGARSTDAADWFRFNLGGTSISESGPSTGFSLCLQNWDNSVATHPVSYLFFYTNNVTVSAATRKPLSGISLQKETPVDFVFTYDDTAKTLKVDYSQGSNSDGFTIPFDAAACFRGATDARVSFWGKVGGCWNENVVGDFSWTGDGIAAAGKVSTRRPALAFDALAGVTAIEKTGDADLAFLRPQALDLPVTLAAGGLRFAKETREDLRVGPTGGWIFNTSTGYYTTTNGLRIGSGTQNNTDVVQSRRKVRVGGNWRASWTMWNLNNGADAIAFVLHNDPRGNQFAGNAWEFAGILGSGADGKTTSKCCHLAFYTYTSGYQNKISCGGTSPSYSQNVSPVTIRSATPIETTLVYDAAAKTLALTLVQGTNTYTHTFENWDVKTLVGGDEAFVALGTGGGGAHNYPYFDDFVFESEEDDTALAATRYVQSIDVTAAEGVLTLDAPVAEGTFRAAETLSVAAGATLNVVAADASATLSVGTLALGAGAKLAGGTDVTVAPDAVTGLGETLAVDGVTFATAAADERADAYRATTIRLTGGAKLKASGVLHAHDVYVDGVRQEQPVYTPGTCSWLVGGRVSLRSGTIMILR